MASLRKTLMELGWRQGMILDPQQGLLEHKGSNGFIVLNQTCDCISDDLENEPFFEVLPFTKLTEQPESMLINGRDARRIHFLLEENSTPIWVSSRMADIYFVSRSKHAELQFSKSFSQTAKLLDGLITWWTARYLRPAFPDDFERALEKPLEKPLKKIGKILKRHDDLIEQILIGLEPQADLVEGEMYEVQLKLMDSPSVYADSEGTKKLNQFSQDIESHLRKVEVFDAPTCSVESLADMSLWDRENFLDFSRYNYLSFDDEEEDSPEH
jgi:hypothetical protein